MKAAKVEDKKDKVRSQIQVPQDPSGVAAAAKDLAADHNKEQTKDKDAAGAAAEHQEQQQQQHDVPPVSHEEIEPVVKVEMGEPGQGNAGGGDAKRMESEEIPK